MMLKRLIDWLLRHKKALCIWGIISAIPLTAIFLSAGYYAVKVEPNQIFVNHHIVRLNDWHDAHDSLRILLISDIHQRRTLPEMLRLNYIVKLANAENADLIFLLGDFMGERFNFKGLNASAAEISEAMGKLRAKYGVFAVLGNHDWWDDGALLRKALETQRITVLENETASVMIAGKPLRIVGLPDRLTRNEHLKPDVLKGGDGAAIILSHDPAYFNRDDLPGELMVAGHTHGGQIRIPLLGAPVTPSQYDQGLFERNGKQLFVTRGVGTSIIKIRFGAPPEIVVLTLKKAAHHSAVR